MSRRIAVGSFLALVLGCVPVAPAELITPTSVYRDPAGGRFELEHPLVWEDHSKQGELVLIHVREGFAKSTFRAHGRDGFTLQPQVGEPVEVLTLDSGFGPITVSRFRAPPPWDGDPYNAEVATAAIRLSGSGTLRVEILALRPRAGEVIQEALRILRSIRKSHA